MKNIFQWLGKNKQEQNKQDNEALKNFINNIYDGHGISVAKAKENIENGVVELIWSNGQHAANGVLITDNGYIMTCYHCVKTDLDQIRIRYGNKKYKVNKICSYDRARDLALIKINLRSKTPRAKNYKFLLEPQIRVSKRIPIVLLCRKDNKIVITGGFFNGAKSRFKDINATRYLTEQNTIPGDSGGVLLSTKGEIIGIHRGEFRNKATSAILFDILDIIEKFRMTLNNDIESTKKPQPKKRKIKHEEKRKN